MGFFSSVLDPAGIRQGRKDAKKAAADQVNAINKQTEAAVQQASYSADQAASIIRNVQMTESATEYARELLGKPMEQVNVRLAPAEQALTTDRTSRARSVRETYMAAPRSWFGRPA